MAAAAAASITAAAAAAVALAAITPATPAAAIPARPSPTAATTPTAFAPTDGIRGTAHRRNSRSTAVGSPAAHDSGRGPDPAIGPGGGAWMRACAPVGGGGATVGGRVDVVKSGRGTRPLTTRAAASDTRVVRGFRHRPEDFKGGARAPEGRRNGHHPRHPVGACGMAGESLVAQESLQCQRGIHTLGMGHDDDWIGRAPSG
eukprot:scaffold8214_cov121-Isochrysis_galbana.AAC.8